MTEAEVSPGRVIDLVVQSIRTEDPKHDKVQPESPVHKRTVISVRHRCDYGGSSRP